MKNKEFMTIISTKNYFFEGLLSGLFLRNVVWKYVTWRFGLLRNVYLLIEI